MPSQEQLISDINKTVANINEATGDDMTKLSAIDSPTLDEQPQLDMTTEETPSTGVAGVLGGAEETVAQAEKSDLQAQEEAKLAEMQTPVEGFQDYLAFLEESPTEAALREETFKEAGVRQEQENVALYRDSIRKEQLRLRRQIEAIEDAGGGEWGGSKAEILNAKRASARYIADQTIGLLGAQEMYQAALDEANRAVDALWEQEQRRLNAYGMWFDLNRELYNKQEQRVFDVQFQREQERIDTIKEKEKQLYETKIDAMRMAQLNDAPQSVLQSIMDAESPLGVVSSAGRYGSVDLLERAIKSQQLASERVRTRKLQAEIDKILDPDTGFLLEGKDKFDAELDLAAVFDKRAGDYKKAATQIGNIDRSYELAIEEAKRGGSINAASQGVLVAFQKLLDPTSVVRESEYARSGQGLSVWSRMEGKWEQIQKGGAGVTAEDLEEFVNTANAFLEGYEDTAVSEARLIIKQANSAGLTIEHILPDSIIDAVNRRFRNELENMNEGDYVTVGETLYRKINGELVEITQ